MKSRSFIVFVLLAVVTGCNRGVETLDAGDIPQTAQKATASPASETIEGTIQVVPPLSEQIPDGAILFLIARTGAPGPPLAVQKMPVPKFPFKFSIGPDDRMIQAMPFKGPILLSARIDTDGNAMTRTPGDLQTNSNATYDPGDRGVTLLIVEAI
jgi:hypothetical protein